MLSVTTEHNGRVCEKKTIFSIAITVVKAIAAIVLVSVLGCQCQSSMSDAYSESNPGTIGGAEEELQACM